MKKTKSNFILINLFYLILSFFFLIYLIGWESLNPFNFKWLLDHDQAGELIGWLDYKNSTWKFPLGKFERGDLGETSAVFHGTIPLLAIISKFLFLKLENFQYFSFWLLLCLHLQGLISYLIIKELTKNNLYSIIGSIFFIISPVFIYRLGIHLSLAGHWLILLYFWVNLIEKKNKHLLNVLIIVTAVGIHFYFAAMIYVVNFLYYFIYYFLINSKKFFFFKFIFLKTIFLIFFMYLIGYFVLPPQDIIGHGFGLYKLNLLSIFDPGVASLSFGKKVIWSLFLPDIKTNYGGHEGFNYLGLGVLLIFFLSIILYFKNYKKPHNQNHLIILIIALILFIFAISNNVDFGTTNLISIELNKYLYGLFGLLRASGRFFWPVNYLIVFFSLLLIFKYVKKFNILFITLILLIQIIDLSPGLKFYSFGKTYKENEVNLNDNVWSKINNNFKTISQTYLKNQSNEFFKIVKFLVKSKIESEIFYSARYNRDKMVNLRYKNYKDLYLGNLNEKIYLVSSYGHLNHLKNIYDSKESIKFINRDDIWLVFSSNAINANHNDLKELKKIESKKVILNKQHDIIYKDIFKMKTFLGMGWVHYKNDLKPWTDGENSSLIMDLSNLDKNKNFYNLELDLSHKILKKNEIINLKIYSNTISQNETFTFDAESPINKKVIFKIDISKLKNNLLILDFQLNGMKSEFENLISPDRRLIGLRLNSLKIIN